MGSLFFLIITYPLYSHLSHEETKRANKNNKEIKHTKRITADGHGEGVECVCRFKCKLPYVSHLLRDRAPRTKTRVEILSTHPADAKRDDELRHSERKTQRLN
jgi:hypothetical protein